MQLYCELVPARVCISGWSRWFSGVLPQGARVSRFQYTRIARVGRLPPPTQALTFTGALLSGVTFCLASAVAAVWCGDADSGVAVFFAEAVDPPVEFLPGTAFLGVKERFLSAGVRERAGADAEQPHGSAWS